ncbi:MAG: hypothetical protein U0796_12865 [Gemmatales bacterium]
MLQRSRGEVTPSPSPLRDEWVNSSFDLWLSQRVSLPLSALPFALMPGTRTFEQLVEGCTDENIQWKFEQIRTMNPRTLRAEVGSATRLLSETFGSPAFALRCSGTPIDVGAFLQSKGILIVERGEVISSQAAATMMGAMILKIIDFVKHRPIPNPPVLLVLEESNNSGLLGRHESQALAETRKYGLFFRIITQTPTFPAEIEDNIFQNCSEHQYFRCASYDVARKAAQDIAAGFHWLAGADISRAETIAQLTTELLHFSPGWRYVRDGRGSRKEFVPLLKDPWVWPSLQIPKLREKLSRIFSKPEYAGRNVIETSSTSSPNTPRLPSRLPDSSSPAERLRQRERRLIDD